MSETPLVPTPTAGVILPRATAPTEETQKAGIGVSIDIRARLAREHARLPDYEAQRQLMERLRAKHAGGATPLLAAIGNGVRSGQGFWFWAFIVTVLSGYAGCVGMRPW